MDSAELEYYFKHLKTEITLLSFIVAILLPNSRKGKYTPLSYIMQNGAVSNEFTEEEVLLLLEKKPCAHLFTRSEGNGEKQYRIEGNHFFSNEERAKPDYGIHKLEQN